MIQRLQSLMQVESLGERVGSDASMAASLSQALSMARGVGRATDNASYTAMLPLLAQFLPQLVTLLGDVRTPALALLLLQVFEDISQGKVMWMTESELHGFADLTLRAIQLWGQYNSARVAGVTARGGTVDELEEEQAGELGALLITLVGILCKEATNKCREPMSNPLYPTQFVLRALNHLLPGFTPGLLLYPSVIKNYFELLEVIVMVHPDQFASMDASAR
jgi:hypothetical protein